MSFYRIRAFFLGIIIVFTKEGEQSSSFFAIGGIIREGVFYGRQGAGTD